MTVKNFLDQVMFGGGCLKLILVLSFKPKLNNFPYLNNPKGLLRYVTFGDETFSSCLTLRGHYREGSKKIQAVVYM